jgi:hypothetical protein
MQACAVMHENLREGMDLNYKNATDSTDFTDLTKIQISVKSVESVEFVAFFFEAANNGIQPDRT